MGIEEMINEYKKQIENNMKYIEGEWACEADRISGMKIAVDVLRKIVKDLQLLKSSLPTQQGETVVPEFVADYLDKRKEQFPVGGLGVAIMHVIDGKESPALFNWMNSNVEVFSRAWLDGYTVEKEPLYWIYDSIADQYLGYDRAEEKVWWLLKQNDGARAELTDAEITKVGEQYRAFAVPAEEESE